MSDPKKPDDTTVHPPRSYDPDSQKPASDRDEAAPGTPGTGEDIDPRTGETFTEGIGGA
ncbi:hypothetical protein [Azospirillum argentinense]|uniref:hypothetical protein n=1 Tax=Azospirillum argentinense TaxID=2970906 RepID=UPI000AC1F844|nr:hypothetical protein [Azospirillum argentinense]